jgi:tRNA(Ile)-lysidine synthase
MLNTVRTFIEKEKLLTADARVIVGLSGGMDSMTLLDLLTLLGYHCVAAHCNFHLRGEESDRDAEFVKKWCKNVDIPFTSIDFDTRQYASDKKISIEMAARELRYRWFEVIREQYAAEAIAVAHHRDDSVETVLLNLIRGTGIRGLAGISAKNKNVVRPLLCVTQEQIAQYMKERDIPYVIDRTNNDEVFWRNWLRLQIIPRLEAMNPAVRDAIYRTSQNVAEAEKVYNASIDKSIDKVFQDGSIHIPELRQTPSPVSVLFELLSPLGFGPSTIQDIYRSMDSTSGKVFYGGPNRIIKDRDRFIIDRRPVEAADQEVSFWISPDNGEIFQPLHLVMRTQKIPVTIQKARRLLYADYDRLEFPLQLRKWRRGDWFIPFGMKGRKKLSDYFTDRKFSLQDKENAWVLLSGDEIVWIVGERPDDRFRITDNTTHVFTVTYNND